jgi:hypothetical protein
MAEEQDGQKMTPDQEVAFHQGSLNTLAKEREGLTQMLQVVEATMQGHIKRMQELGVKFEQPTEDKK